jgi:AraC-like DNA-binding protein
MGTVMSVQHWEQIEAQTTGMTPERTLSNATVAKISPVQAATLSMLARTTAVEFSKSAQGPLPAAGLRHHFDDYVSAVVEANASANLHYHAIDRTYWRRLRQAYSARDFIIANLHDPISMTDLCFAIGVSRRQLEYAFQDAFAVTPRQFIHLRRLNEIRRALLRSQPSRTVTDIALDHGVSHLGRFAISYRALFGESPRQTLAAVRSRSQRYVLR